MSTKDRDQKAKVLRYCAAKRWLAQLEVDVQPPKPVARKAALMTDVDVLASVPNDFVGFRHVLFDCKTLTKESPINRALWLRGLSEHLSAEQAFCVLKKNSIDSDHRLFSTSLGVVLLAEDEFDIFGDATATEYRTVSANVADIQLWDEMRTLGQRFVPIATLVKYIGSTYWMPTEPGEVCRKTVAALHEVRAELDPVKPQHLALVSDCAAVFARSLALLVAYLFKAYLHPRHQSELEEAVKVLLYGGRDAYEHRNQLYKMLREQREQRDLVEQRPQAEQREKKVAGANGDLELPEWSRFVHLIRQLLDAPSEAPRAALILRELAFTLLGNKAETAFLRKLCQESPQGARFAVLIVGYLAKSVRLPGEFASHLEGQLLAVLN